MTKTFSSHFLIVFLGALLFSACEETVMLDLEFESRLVVNSFFDSNSPWQVEVSKSANILDENSNLDLVENARVIIYDQNNVELYELYHQGNGMYGREGYYPSPTRGYYIKVESGPMVVSAYSYVPEKSTLTINNFELVTENKLEGVEVDFQIEDKSNIEAYYIWEIINLVASEDSTDVSNGQKLSDALISNLSVSSLDQDAEKREIIDAGLFGNGTYTTIYNTIKGRTGRRSPTAPIHNDVYSEGNKGDVINHNLDKEDLFLSFDPNGEDGDEQFDLSNPIKNEAKFELRVVSISKELYDYYNNVEAARNIGNNSETAQLKIEGNIENGLGIFAGFNESIIRF